jgi:hypothetical protein
MRLMRRASTTAGLLILALLPVAAAVSPDAIPPTSQPPIALAQPLVSLGGAALVDARAVTALSESGLLVVVGGALLGLAAVVRRTGRA